uniref:Uncharacterized protein n=1 Tax=viral metagenome TaxID=1070528 RepID=A0A6C0DRV1_9ZZZZ
MLSFGPATPSDGDCFTTINPNSDKGPARMADGRSFTDYRPRCLQYPLRVTGQFGEHDGRQKMIQGGDQLMTDAQTLLQKKLGPVQGSCVDTMVPELYKRVCTWRGCTTVSGHYAGIGTGRIYIPDGAAAADDPDGLALATLPKVPNTFSMQGNVTGSQCAIDDREKLWKFLDTPKGYSARAAPYSGPRA